MNRTITSTNHSRTRTSKAARFAALTLGAALTLAACSTGSSQSISMDDDGAFPLSAMVIQAANPLFRQPVPVN